MFVSFQYTGRQLSQLCQGFGNVIIHVAYYPKTKEDFEKLTNKVNDAAKEKYSMETISCEIIYFETLRGY